MRILPANDDGIASPGCMRSPCPGTSASTT